MKNDIEFSVADLRKLPFHDSSFDLVYCISVLEHTDEYPSIIKEFYRILKPGGVLVVTFDISLDNTRDIGINESKVFLSSLHNQFDRTPPLPALQLETQLAKQHVFTTLKAREMDKKSLPWPLPSFLYQAKTLLNSGKLVSWPPPLTVYCLMLTK